MLTGASMRRLSTPSQAMAESPANPAEADQADRQGEDQRAVCQPLAELRRRRVLAVHVQRVEIQGQPGPVDHMGLGDGDGGGGVDVADGLKSSPYLLGVMSDPRSLMGRNFGSVNSSFSFSNVTSTGWSQRTSRGSQPTTLLSICTPSCRRITATT
jgi:hypothetical protein